MNQSFVLLKGSGLLVALAFRKLFHQVVRLLSHVAPTASFMTASCSVVDGSERRPGDPVRVLFSRLDRRGVEELPRFFSYCIMREGTSSGGRAGKRGKTGVSMLAIGREAG